MLAACSARPAARARSPAPSARQTAVETPPPTASEATRAAQAKVAANLPTEGTRDGAFSTRGFLATRADPVILNAAGKPVWNLDGYAFVTGPAPDTVNPSLWRHMTHLKHHGLDQVAAGVWRGWNWSMRRWASGRSAP